jgi:hypothetical protein
LVFLLERDTWVYSQALEEYSRIYKDQIKSSGMNLNDHIEKHFITFKTYYDAIEQGRKLPFSKKTGEEYIEFAKAIRFFYNEDIGRFEFLCPDERITHVQLTPQIAYVLGFEDGIDIKHGQMARYAPDIRGAMSQLCIYMDHGVMESIIFGNTFANLLQLVAVEGNSGETIQKLFPNPLMHRVVAREIDSMDFEIRSIDGRLVKFDYGQVILTLLFKRAIYF